MTGNLTINYGTYNLSGGTLQATDIVNNNGALVVGAATLNAVTLTIEQGASMTLGADSSLTVNISGSTINNGIIKENFLAPSTVTRWRQ